MQLYTLPNYQVQFRWRTDVSLLYPRQMVDTYKFTFQDRPLMSDHRVAPGKVKFPPFSNT